MLGGSFLIMRLSEEALWLSVSMFYVIKQCLISQMFGQLRDRNSPLIPVTGIWQFDLHPKLWEKELSKT